MSVTIAFVENPGSRRDVASRKFWESSVIGKGSEEQGQGGNAVQVERAIVAGLHYFA